jgi:hypothetical protein
VPGELANLLARQHPLPNGSNLELYSLSQVARVLRDGLEVNRSPKPNPILSKPALAHFEHLSVHHPWLVNGTVVTRAGLNLEDGQHLALAVQKGRADRGFEALSRPSIVTG